VKDFLAESYFEKGWESVDRHFRRLAAAAEALESDSSESPEEITRALDNLAAQVELFADHWLHFHMRFEALIREYNLSAEEGGPAKGGNAGGKGRA